MAQSVTGSRQSGSSTARVTEQHDVIYTPAAPEREPGMHMEMLVKGELLKAQIKNVILKIRGVSP
jgi:hypothetical protein